MIAFDHMQTEIPEGDHYDVTVIGVGGAGSNVIDRLALDGMGEAEIVCMNTDIRALSNSMASRKVQLGQEVTKGLGAGGDPELGMEVAEASEAEIRDVVGGRDIIFICAGLGGGTGSGAAPYVARLAREAGAFVVVFAIMPFGFEGKRRRAQADDALELLSKEASALLTFENGRMGELVLPKEGIQAAFSAADQVIGQSVRAVTGIVLRPGLIRIGMDDLIRALENDDSRCLFGYGEATGESRAHEAITAALRSPLLERGLLLSKSRNVLVHVTGGKTMTLIEVELLMTELGKQIGEDAQILFGTGHDPKLGDRLAVTVISSLAQVVEPVVEEAPSAELEPEVEEFRKEEVAEVATEVVEIPEPEVEAGRGDSHGDELGLEDRRANPAPAESKIERGVSAAAMADIEEVVAETLLDLGMDDPGDDVVAMADGEEVVAAIEDFVEIEDEAVDEEVVGAEIEEERAVEDGGDVNVSEEKTVEAVAGQPDGAVRDDLAEPISEITDELVTDRGETEVLDLEEGALEMVADEDVELAPTINGAVESDLGELEDYCDACVDDADEVGGEIEEGVAAVADGVGSSLSEGIDEEAEAVLSEDAIEEEICAVEEKIESIAAAMGIFEPATQPEEPGGIDGEEDDHVLSIGDDEESGSDFAEVVEATSVVDEVIQVEDREDEAPAEDYFVPVDEVVRPSENGGGDEEVEEASSVSSEVGAPDEDESQPVMEEPVTEEPVMEEPVTEEPVMEEPVTEEPVTEEPVMEETVMEETVMEEPVLEEPVMEQAPYRPSPGYGKPGTDDVSDENEAVEEDEEPALAMAADSGHPDPAMAATVGPRVGLVEPKPSDPSGQGMLELDPGARGRFDNSSPTVVDGEDLDVPTFLRKRKGK